MCHLHRKIQTFQTDFRALRQHDHHLVKILFKKTFFLRH
jgi:hypothetical protein